MHRLTALIGAAALLLLVAPRWADAADDVNADAFEIGHIPKCVEAVPAAVGTPGDAVGLAVTVLLDGVSSTRAKAVMAAAAKSYSPLGIKLQRSYQTASLKGTDAQRLIDQAKARFGGARPAGSEVVLVLTAKDIQLDGQTAVAGLADCIGGVAFPKRAFAVAEVMPERPLPFGPVTLFDQVSAKVAAHEVGHLMGAHHHYANCVEGVTSDIARGDGSPCTLMINDVGLASLGLSTLNATIVRGHAEVYAAP